MATYQFDYDLRTAFRLLTEGGPMWWKFSHWALPFKAPAIRSMLVSLDQELAKRRASSVFVNTQSHFAPAAIFINAMVDDSSVTRLEKSWRAAMKGLDGLNAYEGADKKKVAKLKAIAGDPRALAAWQAAAVGSPWVMKNLLWLLVIDGSPESVDALLPHFERARRDRGRLQQLEAVKRDAHPATEPLFLAAGAARSQLREGSTVAALGRRFGFDQGGRARAWLRIPAEGDPRGQGTRRRPFAEIELDSDAPREAELAVSVVSATMSRTTFSESSEPLRCADAGQLPKVLVRAAKKHGVRWNFGATTTRLVAKSKCAAFIGWLRDGDPRP